MNTMKPWWQSKTVWASLVAIAAGVLDLAGLHLAAPLQDELVDLLGGLAGVTAGCIAWYGRLTATSLIGRRQP